MRPKNLVTLGLALFVVATVVTLVLKEMGAGHPPAPAAAAKAPVPGPKLIAYYLHGKVRCVTCNDIEKTTKETVEATFARELASGRIEWRTVNYDEPGNEHFAREFKLAAPCVVLASLRDDKQESWISLPEVWELIGDKPAFHDFIVRNVREAWVRRLAQSTLLPQLSRTRTLSRLRHPKRRVLCRDCWTSARPAASRARPWHPFWKTSRAGIAESSRWSSATCSRIPMRWQSTTFRPSLHRFSSMPRARSSSGTRGFSRSKRFSGSGMSWALNSEKWHEAMNPQRAIAWGMRTLRFGACSAFKPRP